MSTTQNVAKERFATVISPPGDSLRRDHVTAHEAVRELFTCKVGLISEPDPVRDDNSVTPDGTQERYEKAPFFPPRELNEVDRIVHWSALPRVRTRPGGRQLARREAARALVLAQVEVAVRRLHGTSRLRETPAIRRCVRLILATLTLSFSLSAAAETPAFEPKVLRSHVNDEAHLLSAAAEHRLELRLSEFQAVNGPQFVVLTVDTLAGLPVEEYALRTASAWKLGDSKRDDGLLLLIAARERKLRIEIGYGLEGLIPDAVAARVIDEILTPAMRSGRHDLGVEEAIDRLIVHAGGKGDASLETRLVASRLQDARRESSAARATTPTLEDRLVGYLVLSCFGFLFILGLVHSLRRKSGTRAGPTASTSRSTTAGFSSSDSRSGASTSSLSGGGGSFGGGGASGSW